MLISAARRTAVLALATASVLAVWCTSALASYTVPGAVQDPVKGTLLPATGTITAQYPQDTGQYPNGLTTNITATQLGSAWYNGVNNVFTQHYSLFFYGADGRIAGDEQVITNPAGTYTFNDTAGTLTVRVPLPASLVVSTQDPDSGWLGGPAQTITVTSGAITWTIIYKADTAAQRKTLISNHKACDSAAARNRQYDRAMAITNTILALGG
jgi:hypothetical protein